MLVKITVQQVMLLNRATPLHRLPDGNSEGDPNPDHISTSFVERQNLSMRMGKARLKTMSPEERRASATKAGVESRKRKQGTPAK
jgi:hypothetical protein